MIIKSCDLQIYKSVTYLLIYLFYYTITNWPIRKRLTAQGNRFTPRFSC